LFIDKHGVFLEILSATQGFKRVAMVCVGNSQIRDIWHIFLESMWNLEAFCMNVDQNY